MKKTITAIIAGVLASLMFAGPASAAIVFTTDDEDSKNNKGKPSWVPPLTVEEAEKALQDPVGYVQDLVESLRGTIDAGGEVTVDGPRGTAETGITGIQIQMGDDLDVRALDLNAFSTLDSDYWGLPKNISTANVVGATAFWRDMVRDQQGRPVTVPTPPFHSVSSGNPVQHGLPEASITIPDSATEGTTIDWDKWADTAEFVLGLVGPGIVPEEIANALPGSDQDVYINAGELVDGLVEPGTLSTRMSATDARAEAESEVDFANLLGDLATVHEAGIGEHWAVPGGTAADLKAKAVSRELTIKSATLIDVDALLKMLGLPIDELPEPVRSGMAHALGLDLQGFAKHAVEYGSPTALTQKVMAAVAGVEDALAAGVGCANADTVVNTKHGVRPFELADDLELTVPSCVLDPLGALTALQAQLEGYLNELMALVDSLLVAAPLLSVADVKAMAMARAYITEKGQEELFTDLGDGPQASRGTVSVGGIHAPFDVNDTADVLNNYSDTMVTAMNGFLEFLGDEYVDMINLRLVDRAVEEGWIDHRADRAIVHAGLDLVRVYIDPPRVDPEDVLARLKEQYGVDEGVGGALGGLGGGGGGPSPLARPAPDSAPVHGQSVYDPITITVASLDSVASYHRPGVDFPDPCPPGGVDCPEADSSTNLSRGFDPDDDFGAPGGGDGSSGDLPRTGAASGTLPISLAALMFMLASAMGRTGRQTADRQFSTNPSLGRESTRPTRP